MSDESKQSIEAAQRARLMQRLAELEHLADRVTQSRGQQSDGSRAEGCSLQTRVEQPNSTMPLGSLQLAPSASDPLPKFVRHTDVGGSASYISGSRFRWKLAQRSICGWALGLLAGFGYAAFSLDLLPTGHGPSSAAIAGAPAAGESDWLDGRTATDQGAEIEPAARPPMVTLALHSPEQTNSVAPARADSAQADKAEQTSPPEYVIHDLPQLGTVIDVLVRAGAPQLIPLPLWMYVSKPEEVALVVRGLPWDASLSQGIRLDSGDWLLDSTKLANLRVSLTKAVYEAVPLQVDLVDAEGQVVPSSNAKLRILPRAWLRAPDEPAAPVAPPAQREPLIVAQIEPPLAAHISAVPVPSELRPLSSLPERSSGLSPPALPSVSGAMAPVPQPAASRILAETRARARRVAPPQKVTPEPAPERIALTELVFHKLDPSSIIHQPDPLVVTRKHDTRTINRQVNRQPDPLVISRKNDTRLISRQPEPLILSR